MIKIRKVEVGMVIGLESRKYLYLCHRVIRVSTHCTACACLDTALALSHRVLLSTRHSAVDVAQSASRRTYPSRHVYDGTCSASSAFCVLVPKIFSNIIELTCQLMLSLKRVCIQYYTDTLHTVLDCTAGYISHPHLVSLVAVLVKMLV